METGVKKREWVKDAAIIFLAVLLVLTFFSNTIMNRSLPEVATAAVTSGSIVAKVRGSGVVTATGKQQVKAKETRTIRAVMIKAGQEVNAGDVLFVLGEGDENELEQAKAQLRDLQTSYQRASASLPIFNYSSYSNSISVAQNTLNRATQARIEAESKRNNMVNDPLTEAAKRNYEAASLQADSLAEQYEQQKQRMILQLQSEIDTLELQLQGYQQPQTYSEEGYFVENSSEGILASNSDAASSVYTQLENLRSQLSQVYNDIYYYENGINYSSVQAAYDTRDSYYREYSNLAGGYETEYQQAVYAEQDAMLALQNAYDSLSYAQATDSQSLQLAYVELNSISESISIQQEKIKSLAGNEENVVTASVSGVVDTVDCTAGDTVLKDALLCTIEVPDMGHTLSFTVTNDQAKRLRIGDTATVSNYYFGNSVTATLTTIRTDPKNPQSNKVLTFDLTGDVTTGAEMSISVGQKSANYDLIVPNSAIKSDSNGSFVLVVSVKNSPLGNRYTARRVSVEVLANDDNNSAVVADLYNGDYVITTSSVPVSSGDMIRIADNA